MTIGVAGVVVPVLPGLVLVWAGVAVWAFARSDAAGWGVLAAVTLLLAAGTLVKYLLPGRRLRTEGVPWSTLALGALLGVVGFFAVPVIGLPLGFVLGVFLAELRRLGGRPAAWRSTRSALLAVGLSMLIELAAALLAAAVWIGALIIT